MRVLVGVMAFTTACGRLSFDASPDAHISDGPTMTTDAPPSLCAAGVGLLCDGFEGAAFDPRWQLDIEQGTVTPSTARVYRGARSLYAQTSAITTPTTYPRAYLLSFDALPFTGTLYARVFVYLPAPASQEFVQLLNFADGNGQGVSIGTRNGVVVNNDYSTTEYRESATPFPVDRWTCLQMSIPSDTTGTIRIGVDGVDLTDAAIPTGATMHPRPSHVYVGVDWPSMYTSLPASEAWFDELLFSDAPIRCAQ